MEQRRYSLHSVSRPQEHPSRVRCGLLSLIGWACFVNILSSAVTIRGRFLEAKQEIDLQHYRTKSIQYGLLMILFLPVLWRIDVSHVQEIHDYAEGEDPLENLLREEEKKEQEGSVQVATLLFILLVLLPFYMAVVFMLIHRPHTHWQKPNLTTCGMAVTRPSETDWKHFLICRTYLAANP